MNKIISFTFFFVATFSLIVNGQSTPGSLVNSTVADSSKYTVKKLYTDFKNPWGMVWLPDGRMLVTERAGDICYKKCEYRYVT